MEALVSSDVYSKIQEFVQSHALAVREVEHAPEGRTDAASRIRGNALAAAVKAMVVMVKRGSARLYAVVCVPGDRRVSFDEVKRVLNGDDARFAPQDRAAALTGCVM